MPGVAMLPPATDKDMLLLIDTSGSMQGARIKGATDNALKIYREFTDKHDHVGLLHFHHTVMKKMPLQPRKAGSMSGSNDQEKIIDATRKPEWGRTAFYDALIQAIKTKVRRAQPNPRPAMKRHACAPPNRLLACRACVLPLALSISRAQPQSSNSYLVALTDGADVDSKYKLEDAEAKIAKSPWTLLVVGLEVREAVREKCERLANASAGGMYMHAANAGGGLDAAFAAVAAQFVMPKVKSADAATSGGGVRGV